MQPTSAVTPNIHQDLWISRVKSLPYRNIHTAGPENETQDGHVASVVSISFTSDDQHVQTRLIITRLFGKFTQLPEE